MVRQNTIIRFLNELLKVKKIEDSSINGLQVNSNPREIKKVAFAVDACIDSFEKAKSCGCELIIVHHGLFWKNKEKEKDRNKEERIKFLKRYKLSLYAVHLPLDIHPTLGNNAYLKRIIGINSTKYFAPYHGLKIGFYDNIKPINRTKIARIFGKKLDTEVKILPFGPEKISTIGIVSGGGAFALPDCNKRKIDTLFTGEIKHSNYYTAKESKINVLYAGHYATEKGGLYNLMPIIEEKFNVQTIFIESPTGL